MALSKVERLKLLAKLAEHFELLSYPMIDAALEAFDVPTFETWDGDKNSYLVATMKGASDEAIGGLAQFAGLVENTPPSPPPVSKDRKFKKFRLFVSHVSTHKELAGNLADALRVYGIHPFVAHTDITPTVEWLVEIERRLGLCDGLLALLNDGFKASDWTDQEVGWVLGRGKPVISVRYDLTPYGFFGKAQAFNGNGKTAAQLAREIFRRLAEHPASRESISHGMVGHFYDSGSFAQAKESADLLSLLTYWDDVLKAKLSAAVEENSQVSSSFGVPEKVASLLKKV